LIVNHEAIFLHVRLICPKPATFGNRVFLGKYAVFGVDGNCVVFLTMWMHWF
jgi:hypothetical protein